MLIPRRVGLATSCTLCQVLLPTVQEKGGCRWMCSVSYCAVQTHGIFPDSFIQLSQCLAVFFPDRNCAEIKPYAVWTRAVSNLKTTHLVAARTACICGLESVTWTVSGHHWPNPRSALETLNATREDVENTAIMLKRASFCFPELQWLRSVWEQRLLGNL